jgi:lipoprotein-releasing system permease protein
VRPVLLPYGLVLGAGVALAHLRLAGPGVRYAAQTALQLVVVVVLTIAVAAAVCFAVIWAVDRFGKQALLRSAVLKVAWHLLRSQQGVPTMRARRARFFDRLAERPSLTGAAFGAILAIAVTAAAWTIPPWAPWVPPSRDAATIACVVGLLAGFLRLLLARVVPVSMRSVPGTVIAIRRRRRLTLPTFIAVVGIAVGVWALIVVLSVMRGFGEDLRDKILQVDAHVHLESSQLDVPLEDARSLLEAIKGHPGVLSTQPIVMGRAILSTRYNTTASVDLKGVDPYSYGSDSKTRAFLPAATLRRLAAQELLVEDRALLPSLRQAFADSDGEDGDDSSFPAPSVLFPAIVLGSELADSLQVGPGDTVEVITPDGDETPLGVRPRTRTFRVAGSFHTGMYQYDLRLAYLALWDAAELFDLEGAPNRIEVVARDPENTGPIAAAMESMAGAREVEVSDWKRMNQALLSALELERVAMFLVLGFIVLVASFNIVGSLVLIIMEKAREIAILRAMGASARWVARTFLTIGGAIGVIGVGTGLALGLGSCAFIAWVGVPLPREYYVERVPVDVDPPTVLAIVVAAALVVLAATAYPTRAAARLVPSDGLRHE